MASARGLGLSLDETQAIHDAILAGGWVPAVERIVADRLAPYVEAVGRVEALADAPAIEAGMEVPRYWVSAVDLRDALGGVAGGREGESGDSPRSPRNGPRSDSGTNPRVSGPSEADESPLRRITDHVGAAFDAALEERP